MKVLIAPNSFKESLHSREITDIIAQSLTNTSTKFQIIKQPVTDGGTGFLRIMTQALNGTYVCKRVNGPLEDSIVAMYGWCEKQKTTVIELAQAAGLGLVRPGNRDPLKTTTIGVGQLIRSALEKGTKHILLGIGDSATIDCGVGALSSLGVRFFDRTGEKIPLNCRGLLTLHRIDASRMMQELHSTKITVAADVDNVLTGKNGALVYAMQKGATGRTRPIIGRALRQFKKIMQRHAGVNLDLIPGSGAAGGVGGAFYAVLGARLKSGFSLVSETVHLDRTMQTVDYVITGEGMIDRKSHYGKATTGIIEMAQNYNKPVILIAGDMRDNAAVYRRRGVMEIYTLTAGQRSKQYAMTHARDILQEIAQKIGQRLLETVT